MYPPTRIYDTFLFDGELDLLQHRLRENYDHTDVFVLVEAAQTYRGEPKPLHFELNRARFAWASSKLRAVKLNALGGSAAEPRVRAEVQRNSILLGLYDAAPTDVVLLLDADEIPSEALLRKLRADGLQEPHRLQMTRHYQKLNILAPASTCCIDRQLPFAFATGRHQPPTWNTTGDLWSGRSGVATPVRCFQKEGGISPYALRFGVTARHVLKDAGRHLTVVDPSASLSRKLGRVFHAEWATELGTYLPHLLRCEEHAVHHRGWWYAELLDGTLPPDLARLASACPAVKRTTPLLPVWKRRLVRTWAWFRVWRGWPAPWVRFIDRNFEVLLIALALPLTVIEFARFILAVAMAEGRSLEPDGHSDHPLEESYSAKTKRFC
jgi:beta-1,4-mannosyl-glycoprotein beta-1,4-N-acetylglucosaminyltransferase